jgi:hypothetical protein
MHRKNSQPPNKKDKLWAEAKHKCRLNAEDIRIAKEMGLNPLSLIKNVPSRAEPWKLPVKDWIREMYQKKQEKSARKKARKGPRAAASPVTDAKQLPKDGTPSLAHAELVSGAEDHSPDQQESQDENRAMLRRQEQFRIAAKHVADCLSGIPEVH